jgi:hypothetical protein
MMSFWAWYPFQPKIWESIGIIIEERPENDQFSSGFLGQFRYFHNFKTIQNELWYSLQTYNMVKNASPKKTQEYGFRQEISHNR